MVTRHCTYSYGVMSSSVSGATTGFSQPPNVKNFAPSPLRNVIYEHAPQIEILKFTSPTTCLLNCVQDKPVVFYLFVIYSLIEVFRYPYYMLRIYDLNVGLLTW
jgi:hypothetical protein